MAGQQPLARAIRVDWEPGREQRFSDRGIGVVHLAAAPGTGTARLDTILLRARPDTATVVIGAFLYTETQKGGAWRYSIAAPIRIEPNVLEFAYEEAGVPLDSLTADASWGRALLGFDAGGTPYRGWVRLDPVRVNYRLWGRELPGHSLFFLSEQGARVLDRPGGRVVADILPAEAFGDYSLHPVKARGAWLQVRLARPADTGGPRRRRRTRLLAGFATWITAGAPWCGTTPAAAEFPKHRKAGPLAYLFVVLREGTA